MRIVPEHIQFDQNELILLYDFLRERINITESKWQTAKYKGFETRWSEGTAWDGVCEEQINIRRERYREVYVRTDKWSESAAVFKLAEIEEYFVQRGLFKGNIYKMNEVNNERIET